jgi:hypothetical protein
MNGPLRLVLHQRAAGAPEIHIVRDQEGMYFVEKWKRVSPLSFGSAPGVPFSLAGTDLRTQRFRTIEELQAAVMNEMRHAEIRR